MKRIGFVGVPGSGKSSIARGMAARAYETLGRVELVAEYARRYIAKYNNIDCVSDQYRILQKQLEWENSIPEDNIDIIITDSPVHMGFLYALELRDLNKKKDVIYMNDIFKVMNKINCPHRYDIIFHLPPIWKPKEDGVRPREHFEDKWRQKADNIIQFIFKLFPPKNFYQVTSDEFEGRITECLNFCRRIL
jgi:nicotinamide riboside kinase